MITSHRSAGDVADGALAAGASSMMPMPAAAISP
jgi:hypothetical protein